MWQWGKRKHVGFCLTGAAERVVASRDVQKAQFGPFAHSICSYFCKSVGVVPSAIRQAPFGPFSPVATSSLCPWQVKGNSLGQFLSPVHKCPKIAVKLDVRTPGRLVEEKSPRLSFAAADIRRRKSIVLLCSSVGAEEIPYLLGSSLPRTILG